jgi:hypothetical protein
MPSPEVLFSAIGFQRTVSGECIGEVGAVRQKNHAFA